MPTTSRLSGSLCALGFAGAAALLFSTAAAHAQDFPVSPVQPVNAIGTASAAAAYDIAAIAASASPMEQRLDLSGIDFQSAGPSGAASRSAAALGDPVVSQGHAGRTTRVRLDEADYRGAASAASSPEIEAQNFGFQQLNTMFHYNDYREFPRPLFYPERSIGKLLFRPAGAGANEWYSCTATLINNNILLTAGHCVYEGGTGDNTGWNQEGIFVPAYSGEDNGENGTFGYCRVRRWSTTSGWFNEGALNQAYDIGLALCGRIEGATATAYNRTNPGASLGYLSFCYSNCRRPFWFLSQFGYPANYYFGEEMTVSQHLEVSGDNNPTGGLDYFYGTGMRGGSSGGPHISNVGEIQDSASSGQFARRNVVFAVTSWGYVDDRWKLQGSTPLTGANNEIDFRAMFNQMCGISRRVIGRRSCRNI